MVWYGLNMHGSATYYDILHTSQSATDEEIKASFRRLAQKHHPDKHNNSAESQARFLVIHNAYTILADPQKRSEYDRYIRHSSIFSAPASADLHPPALPGRHGEIYLSTEELLAHFNYLLWDIEDLIRNNNSILWENNTGEITPRYYVLKILTFIDKWVLEPAGFPDYFMEARRLAKRDPSGYMHTIGKAGSGHQPFVNLNHYFYNIRIRIDKFLSGINTANLLAAIPGKTVSLLECCIEAQNMTIHYLGALRAGTDTIAGIPGFAHSHPFFSDSHSGNRH